MNVSYAHLCDYATISREGKLSVMGIFDNIFVTSVPAVQQMMYLAFGLELRAAELGVPFRLKIKLVTQDGIPIAELDGEGRIDGIVGQRGPVLRVPQMMALGGVPFVKLGAYSIDIFINDDHKMAVNFQVSQRSASPEEAAGGEAPEGGAQ